MGNGSRWRTDLRARRARRVRGVRGVRRVRGVRSFRRAWRAPTLAGVVALATGLTLTGGPAGAGVIGGPPSSGRTSASTASIASTRPTASTAATIAGTKGRSAAHTVTLLSGDRVTVDGDRVTVRPGKGRERMKFLTKRRSGHLSVVPLDALAAIGTGRLDRRLFDVTDLIRFGYDDAHGSSIPMLVQYAPGNERPKPFTASGVQPIRALSAIDGEAIRVAKTRAPHLWPELLQGKGVRHLWLDGKRHVNLNESVPQIGAPTAWKAGYTGKGIKVAVVDTGIDTTHPDLSGKKVVAVKDFTGEGPKDGFGHGTHVASIIAGTAKASKGKYRGVAPDASLISAKVCDAEGSCADDAILAGMEWAARTQHARIANLSLGGGDTPDLDPLEEAVNRLTEQTGTLFAIAAGNDGGDNTIESPGSADAALTVGAVTKKDELADFSSRGPRLGDNGIKPDVSAPGVDIAAARAAGTELGPPVKDYPKYYVRLDGTSMATPHAAGAAALLAQQHKGWKAAQLKDALMNSARSMKDQTLFEQGAGRIAVDRAIGVDVLADPGSVSFGIARWPHRDDKPVTRKVTYRNDGKKSVALALGVRLNDPKGHPAPAAAVRLSASKLTVPAGGSASVTVTSNTNHAGPDGTYTGAITAKAGTRSIVTPIAVTKEIESYDVTVKHLDRSGAPTANYLTDFVATSGPGSWTEGASEDGESTLTVRLPKGHYLVDDTVFDDEAGTVSHTAWANLTLDRAQTLDADSRRARPVTVTPPNPAAVGALADISYTRVLHLADGEQTFDAGILGPSPAGTFIRGAGPATPKADLSSRVDTQWGKPGKKQDFRDSPWIYHLVWYVEGSILTGFHRQVRPNQLAKVVTDLGVEVDKRMGGISPYALSRQGYGGWSTTWPYDLPRTVTQYRTTEGVSYGQSMTESVWDPEGQSYVDVLGLDDVPRRFEAGKAYRQVWNRGVFGPSLPAGEQLGAWRDGDAIAATIPMFSDSVGHIGSSGVDTSSTTLLRDGKEVGNSGDVGYLDPIRVGASPATYTLTTSATRGSVSHDTTKLRATWTFRSSHAAGTSKLPLWVARFSPRVDARSISHEGPAQVVPLRLQPQPGSAVGTLAGVTLQVSGDDGRTWNNGAVVPVGQNTYAAVVIVPPAANHVSLRVKAHDNKGNSVVQTLIRAYAMAS